MAAHRNAAAAGVVVLAALALALHAGTVAAAVRPPRHQDPSAALALIRSSCRATEYPRLCVRSLSAFAGAIQNPAQLADVALAVSLRTARSATAAMTKMAARRRRGMGRRAASVIGDCLETMGDSVDELRDSLRAIGRLNRRNVRLQISNIQTWVSAALTDDDTCMEELAGKAIDAEVRAAVRGHITRVAQLTRNALALINTLATTTAAAADSP